MGIDTQTDNPIFEVINSIVPPKKESIIETHENLYLFFSIDLCNSTQMKDTIREWFSVTNMLYNERFTHMHFWKYNGDEVLYAEPFDSLESLVDIIQEAYYFIGSLQGEMRKLVTKKDNPEEVALKGTFWLARTYDKNSQNILIKTQPVNEFLGKSIDEGFRISKKVSESKIVLDSKIVYLLLLTYNIYGFDTYKSKDFYGFCKVANDAKADLKHKIHDMLKNIYFMGYVQLKGIWKNRGYPVFWYFTDKNSCAYDEQLDKQYVVPEAVMDEKGLSKWFSQLSEIYKAVHAQKEFNCILKFIAKKSKYQYSLDSFSRLYYSVVCYNPKSENVLIAQRSTERQHLKGVWEFGTYKHSTVNTTKVLCAKIKDTFGIDVDLLTDGEPEENIIPLHFCTIYRNGQAHNSILCAAVINGDKTDEEILKIIDGYRQEQDNKQRKKEYEKYAFVNIETASEYKSITLEEIESDSYKAISNKAEEFSSDSAVMYFKKSIKVAIRYCKERYLSKTWDE